MDLAARGAHGGGERRLDHIGVLLADRPAGQADTADGLGGGPAQDAFGFVVPVRDRAVRGEGDQGGVHAVQERGEQSGVVGLLAGTARRGR